MCDNLINTLPLKFREGAKKLVNGKASEIDLYDGLCCLFTPPYPICEILPSQVDLSLLDAYPPGFCEELGFIPVSRSDIYVTCVSNTPWDMQMLEKIRARNYDSIRMLCVTESCLSNLLEYVKIASVKHPIQPEISLQEKPICKSVKQSGRTLVREMLEAAYSSGASDIHIEPAEGRIAVKFRLNGELHVQEPVCSKHSKAFLDEIKNLSTIPINETKTLADCRFSTELNCGKKLDFRVAKLPISGRYENFVLRILDSDSILRCAGSLPFSGEYLTVFNSCLNAESGMIILTGPTGSGKTTTLYSAMTSLDLAGLNVRTVEDPIEYRLPKAVQTQIDAKNGVTFARTLRSMLRADPDVIMVGEIRDAETAELAAAAANTGHLVLTTLHTKSAIGVIPRLCDLGLTKGDIQEVVSLVVSQRLIPKLCPHCRSPRKPGLPQKHLFESYGLPCPAVVFERLGCPLCANTGIIGRLPVFEFLLFSPKIREMLAACESIGAVRRENEKAYPPLVFSVLKAVAEGFTPFDTVLNFSNPV